MQRGASLPNKAAVWLGQGGGAEQHIPLPPKSPHPLAPLPSPHHPTPIPLSLTPHLEDISVFLV